MYESSKRKINWLRLFLIIIIVFLILLLTLKCISMIKNSGNNNKYYDKQLETLDSTAKKYFNEDNIPTEVGKSVRISISEFDDKDIDYTLKSKSGDTCDLNDSFIQATRLETEYQVKSYIKCDSYDDYINTYVSLVDGETTTSKESKTSKTTTKKETTTKALETTTTVKKETTTKAITSVKTTKKAATTIKKVTTTTKANLNTTQATVKAATDENVTIGFNSNGGNQISSIDIKKGSTTDLPVPARTGYTFVGWYKNGVKYTSNTVFNDSVILVAEWSKN